MTPGIAPASSQECRHASLLRRIAGQWPQFLVFLVSLVVYVWMADNSIAKVYYPTGDEPYYLVMAHSLINDHDLELTNEFAERVYWDYYPGELYPRHESITVRPGLWSKHAAGVAVLIVPGYLGETWRGGALTICLLAALLAANVYLLGSEVSGRKALGFAAWLLLCFTNPIASYAPLIFPAIPGALFTVYSYRQIRLGKVPADLPRTLAVSACIGALPWLNAQMVPISAGLFLYALAKAGPAQPTSGSLPERAAEWLRYWVGRGWTWLAFLAPVAVLAIADMGYYLYLYDSIVPNWQDHAGSSGLAGTIVGFFGMFFDQQWGLIVHAPIYLLAFSGLLLMWRKARHELAWLAMIGLPYFLLIINYKQWWGEWCPPARYVVPLMPLMAVPLVRALPALRRRSYLLLVLAIAATSYGVTAAYIHKPRLLYNHPTGGSNLLLWLAEQGWPDLTGVVPTYFIEEAATHNLALTLVWSAAAFVIVLLGARAASRTGR